MVVADSILCFADSPVEQLCRLRAEPYDTSITSASAVVVLHQPSILPAEMVASIHLPHCDIFLLNRIFPRNAHVLFRLAFHRFCMTNY